MEEREREREREGMLREGRGKWEGGEGKTIRIFLATPLHTRRFTVYGDCLISTKCMTNE